MRARPVIIRSIHLCIPVRFPEQERDGPRERACRERSPYTTPGRLTGACVAQQRPRADGKSPNPSSRPPPGKALSGGKPLQQGRPALLAPHFSDQENLGGAKLSPKAGRRRKRTAVPPHPQVGFWGCRCYPMPSATAGNGRGSSDLS